MEIEIIIDGKKFKADSSDTILSIARKNNIDIPTLCFLKHVNEPASCRICVVEVEGMNKLVTACTTRLRDGMVIKTNTNVYTFKSCVI